MNKMKHKTKWMRLAMTLALIVLTATTAWAVGLSGSGTAANPYLITSATDWTTFVNAVNSGTTYENKIVKLTADISGITTMAGTSDNRFKGTFMGDGHTLTVNYTATANDCAPFLYIEGATIYTLKVTGTITTGYQFAAGIAAHSYGNCTIHSCWSNVAIISSVDGDGTHAGFVAVQEDGSLRITNCLFDGSITGSNTIKCGGMVGWRKTTLVYTNCFQNGTLNLKETSGSATFNRNGGSSFSNSYYKTAYGDVQGKQTDATGSTLQAQLGPSWEVSGDKVIPIMNLNHLGTATISGVKEYYIRTGQEIKPEPVVTAVDGTVLTKNTHYTLAWSGDGRTDGTYTIIVTGKGSYTGSRQISYLVKSTETLGDHDFQVDEDENGLFYKINTSADLRALARYVNSGNQCKGKRFIQTADIDLGGSSSPFTPANSQFRGIYDGGNHFVSGLYIQDKPGFFCNVVNGTFRNVILDSPSITATHNVTTTQFNGGALIGYTSGATVENCLVVSPTLNVTGSGTIYTGALIGEASNSTHVTNCYLYVGTGNVSTGIGKKNDSTTGDVSRSVYKVTLGSNVGLPSPAPTGGFNTQNSHYYLPNATAQLSYTGNNPNGYRPIFTISPTNTGASVSNKGVLTMGNADITITATLSNETLINIATGTIANIPDQVYTGSPIVPDITLTVNGEVLEAGTDYTVSCTNNVNGGYATLTATGQGYYAGTLTKQFRIYYADRTGSCGTGVTYTLHDDDQDGHYEQFTISGTGAMTDYATPTDVPWAAHYEDITSATVGSGVTHIGAYTFYNCLHLTSVSLPIGLTSVGSGAFNYFNGEVTFPRSLTSIAAGCFDNCPSATKVYITVPDNCLLTVNGEPISATDGKADLTSIIGVGTSHAAVTLACTPDPVHFVENSDGSYTIRTVTGWNIFCDILKDYAKGYFTGKTVKLEGNVGSADNPVKRMAGSSQHDFTGTFDGGGNTLYINLSTDNSHDYTAPFSYVTTTKANPSDANDTPAAIRNLKVTGTAECSRKYGSGLVGGCWGVVNIENCLVSTVIESLVEGDGTHGGIVGRPSSGTVTICGCVFDGKIVSTSSTPTTRCAGFVGYNNGSTLTITKSLYAPQSDANAVTDGATFARNWTPGTNDTGIYYTQTLGDAQGKASRTVTGDDHVTVQAIALTGDQTVYTVSGITTYSGGGLAFGDQIYYGSGDAVKLTLDNTPLAGYQFSGYAVSEGSLSGSDNPYTLVMPDADVTVNLSTQNLVAIDWAEENTGDDWDNAYMIYNKDQLNMLAQRVNSEDSQTGTWRGKYEGKYFKLGADITYSYTSAWNETSSQENNYTAIGRFYQTGNVTGHYYTFNGHFDGQGHTVSGIRIYQIDNSYDQHYAFGDRHQGLFGVTAGADIRGITLTDTRITAGDFAGGIVGNNGGDIRYRESGGDVEPTVGDGRGYFPSTVSDCHATSTVIIHAARKTTDTHGGIVGYNYIGCEVSDCTSAAKISGNPDNNEFTYFGGVVGWNYKGTLRSNLAIGSIVTTVWDYSHGAICGRNNDGTFENNYYQACTVAGTANATNVGIGNITLVSGEGPGDRTDNNGAVPTLRDNANNSVALGLLARLATAGINGTPLDLGWGPCKYPMQLAGRTLYKDGYWNTLCLPFDVTIADSPLAGAEARTLSSASIEDGTLTLTFSDPVATIAAGTPYIIKWKKAEDYDEDDPNTRDIKNPVFSNVTVNATASTEANFEGIKFVGSYSPFAITAENKNNILYIGSANKIGHSAGSRTLRSCRAHFELTNPSAAPVRTVVVDYGEEEIVTEIISMEDGRSQMEDDSWYTMSGIRLNGEPTEKGFYLFNGKKVVVQ